MRPFALAESAWARGVASTGVGLAATLRLSSIAITLLGAVTTSTTPYQATASPRASSSGACRSRRCSVGKRAWVCSGSARETGLALDVLRFDGKSVPNAEQALRVNPGLRAECRRARACQPPPVG